MKELIAIYMEKVEERDAEAFDPYLEVKAANMLAAERHIADHIAELDEAGELLPVKTALAISADGADRLGYGKKQTNLNVNVDFGKALEKAIARSGKVINHSPAGPASRPQPAQRHLPTPTPAPASAPRPLIARRA